MTVNPKLLDTSGEDQNQSQVDSESTSSQHSTVRFMCVEFHVDGKKTTRRRVHAVSRVSNLCGYVVVAATSGQRKPTSAPIPQQRSHVASLGEGKKSLAARALEVT
ncbi:hypothetical protein AC1031_007284 [Aphanomyces cochlioides]|nr:hypothetical protein AC1031_007284 [Aphanomyces cochlioides]